MFSFRTALKKRRLGLASYRRSTVNSGLSPDLFKLYAVVPTITHSVLLATPACRFRFSNSAWFFICGHVQYISLMGLVWHAVLILLFMWYAGIVHTNKGRNPHPTRRKNEQLRMLLLRPQQSNSQRHLRPLPQKLLRRLPIPVLQLRRRLLLRPLPPVLQVRQHRLRQIRGTMQHLRQHVLQRLPELLRQVRRILLRR